MNIFRSPSRLMINSVFGKFIEQTRNYLNVRLCKNETACSKLITSPRFSNLKIISEGLVAVFLKQPTITLNKAFPIGFSILERSKDFMYKQFYQVIRPQLHHAEVDVLFSDTDSFGLRIKSQGGQQEDVFEKLRSIFDFSNYPTTSAKFSKENAGKLGYWKDEVKQFLFQAFTETKSSPFVFCRFKGEE